MTHFRLKTMFKVTNRWKLHRLIIIKSLGSIGDMLMRGD